MKDRLQGVVVNLRADIEVSRHVTGGEPMYVVRDPVSFQSNALTAEEYELFVALDLDASLGETFAMLLQRGSLSPDEEEDFYAFVLSLHRAGMLSLPVSDGKALYQRYERKRKAKRGAMVMQVFFTRVPVWNPDAFLERTIALFRPLFTRWAFTLWAMLMLAAIGVAAARFDELTAPLLTLLEFQNLPVLWVMLIALKVFHEFGHAYACKAFGGSVPEMGLFFIVGTPCAYVDASAAWGFPDRSKRIVVSLAGMYAESFFAAIALFVWAATEPGLVNSLAYQTALLSSLVTIGFNLNPLAKFDGYYVLSDATGIPNLRARASEQLLSSFNRVALGLPAQDNGRGLLGRIFLAAFGLGSSLYKITLVVGISAMIATKFFLVGVALAGFYVLMSLVGFLSKSARYLWLAPETAPVRARAVAVSVLCLAVLPAALVFAPVSTGGDAWGTVEHERETVVRAGAAGIVAASDVDERQVVAPGDRLAVIESAEVFGGVAIAEAEHLLAVAQRERSAGESPAEYAAAEPRVATTSEQLASARERAADLEPVAPHEGRVVFAPLAEAAGSFVRAGDTIAVIGDGGLVVRMLVDEDLLAGADPRVGDAVSCRLSSDPGRVLMGTIDAISPAGSREIDDASLTASGIGAIAAAPGAGPGGAARAAGARPADTGRAGARPADTGRAVEPVSAGRAYFVVTVRLPADAGSTVLRGATVRAKFDTEREPAGLVMFRRVSRFFHDLRSG